MARLMRADPGLPRRFPQQVCLISLPTTLTASLHQVHLADYSPEELASIAKTAAHDRFDLDFEPGLEEKLCQHITDQYSGQIPQSNGGLAVNLCEAAMGRLTKRVMATGKVGREASQLIAADFEIDAETSSEEARRVVEEDIVALVGMSEAKQMFNDLRKRVQYVENGGNRKVLQVCLNMVITGNPGVGKTTLARLIGRFLHAYGVLPKDTFVERNGLELKGKYVGHSAPQVQEAVADAMGGTLFIDEVHVYLCVFIYVCACMRCAVLFFIMYMAGVCSGCRRIGAQRLVQHRGGAHTADRGGEQ